MNFKSASEPIPHLHRHTSADSGTSLARRLGRCAGLGLGTRGAIIAVRAYGLHRATFKRLHALVDFFLGGGLLENVGMAAVVMAGEKARRSLATEIAVNALLIHVEFPGNIVFPFVVFIGHGV